MKVLFQNRADALTHWGGDSTQMMETRRELEKLGWRIDVCLDPETNLSGYDLVHVFNIQNAVYGVRQVRNAKKANLPCVVSTIFWDTRHVARRSTFGRMTRAALAEVPFSTLRAIPFFLRTPLGRRRLQVELGREMLKAADVILPNSHAEAEIIVSMFGLPELRMKAAVIPNGVHPPPLSGSLPKQSEFPFAECVLQVGRIEQVKGQLAVIQALMEHRAIPIVFVGRGVDTPYGHRRGNVHWVGQVPHEELDAYYRLAKVHVLPSLRESPGLVTLEAATRGANCVVSFHAPILEYFGQDAWACDPDRVDSVTNALIAAWSAPRSERLRKRVLECFTWARAAQTTQEAYHHVLSRRSGLNALGG